MKHRIAVFASGSGTNFEAIANAVECGELQDCEIVLMVCDKPGARVIERAERHNVEALVFRARDYVSKTDYERMIADRLDSLGVELVCLAGYMRIVGPELLSRYRGRLINIHPALLPAFPGAHAIKDAFEYGVKVYGVTVHHVNEEIDGGKIITQEGFSYYGDDIDEVEGMIHSVEHRLFPATIRKYFDQIENTI